MSSNKGISEMLRIPPIITSSELVRMSKAETFKRLAECGELLVITGSKPTAVLVDIERWQKIQEALFKADVDIE